MNIFEKNLENLSDKRLKQELINIKQSPYKIILGINNIDINLQNGGGHLVYQNALKELENSLKLYNEKYINYPVLYYYGFGNGILYKTLAQNQRLNHIVIFENDLELLFTVFSNIDFSNELKAKKIILIASKFYENYDFINLCGINALLYTSRIYHLELHSDYYSKFEDEIIRVNKAMIEGFSYQAKVRGNDPIDALKGTSQYLYNLNDMCENFTVLELIKKRKFQNDTAIIVSTGPSLSKQLPLLKEYEKKAVIFCADSAYSILMRNNIVPDYVFMLEREELTAEFFNHDFKDDKNTIFIVDAVVHKNAIKYLKQKNKKFIIMAKSLHLSVRLTPRAFGYVINESNVAVLAFNTASFRLGFKNIIIIGQDLAYDESGASHPKDYQNGSNFESTIYEHIEIPAYGGNGFIKSHKTWLMFKENLEIFLRSTKARVINATQGGAKINFCEEMPFKKALELFCTKDKKDVPLERSKKEKQSEYKLKIFYKLSKIKKDFKIYTDFLNKNIQELQLGMQTILDGKDSKDIKTKLQTLLIKAENAKIFLEDENNLDTFYELIYPVITQFNMNLSKIVVLVTKDEKELVVKMNALLNELSAYFIFIQANTKIYENEINKAFDTFKNILEKDFAKYIKRIK